MIKLFVKIAASFFYVGYLPWTPGTAGSAAGLALAWILYPHLLYWTLALCVVGFLVCAPAEQVFGAKDPQTFVLDEVCGMMLSVIWLPKEIWVFATAFILFRLLDWLKPWPISILQRQKNPLSIMWDDLAAGLATNLIVWFLLFLLDWLN
jgi:phosphatidylglycerophosphatase A